MLLFGFTALQMSWLAPWMRLLASFVVAWWLPGALLLLRIIRPPDIDLPTAFVLSIGLGLGWMMSVALFVYYIPGPISLALLFVSYAVGALLLCILGSWLNPLQPLWLQRSTGAQNTNTTILPQKSSVPFGKPTTTPDLKKQVTVHPPVGFDRLGLREDERLQKQTLRLGSGQGWDRALLESYMPTKIWLLLLGLLALLLRLPGLGYHEFHVDEVSVLRAARRAIEGVPEVLAEHTKGPGEILVSIVGYGMLGNIDELTGRLPFALMSVVSVLALMLLGRLLFSDAVGFWAGILLALNGFALGLSRIAQYQGGMLLFTVLAAHAGWEFAQRGKARWLLLSIAFAAFGILLHYEAVLMLPLLSALAWHGWCKSRDKGGVLKTALAAATAGAIILAIAYIPLLINESFNRTQDYLSNRLGDLTNFNGAFFVEMGTFYNSIYFFVGSLLLILVGIGFGLSLHRKNIALLILWFLPNFILYFFVMQFPGTHFYTMAPAWSLLAAIGAVQLISICKPLPLRWATTLILVGWVILSANYLRLIFFQQEPEYLINYREERLPLYWAPYGENIPEKPRFGFPLREGWKAAGLLAEWGYLGDSYTSNERSRHLRRWYLESISRRDLQELPDTVFVAHHVQDRNRAFDDEFLESNYQKVGEIRVREEPRIELWRLDSLPAANVSYDAESFERAFDDTIPLMQQSRGGQVPPHAQIVVADVALSDKVRLDSAWIINKSVARGELLYLTLVWQARQQLQNDYKIFVHVVDGSGSLRTQWDGYPGQNTTRTTTWTSDEPFVDHVLLKIPTELEAAEYRIVVGLYDEATGERVGNEGNSAIEVGSVLVK